MLALAALAAFGFGSTAWADQIGINFVGGSGPAPNPTPMGAAEIAGFVPQANWNQAAGQSGTNLALLNQNGIATTATLTSWTSANTWNTSIAEAPGDFRMMRGYLDTSATSHTMVTVSAIPYAFYDVYVYTDGDHGGDTRSGNYTIGGKTNTTTNPANVNFNGTFILGQTYTVFTGLSGASFTLDATPGALGGTLRAPVNGIQIVASAAPVPEPGTLALAGLGILSLMGYVWKRRNLTA
jgi:hypothetical protein